MAGKRFRSRFSRLYRRLFPFHGLLPDNENELKELLRRLQIPVQGLHHDAGGQAIFNRVEAQRRIREIIVSRRAWRYAAIAALASVFSSLAAWYSACHSTSK